MLRISPQELAAVSALPGPERYAYFVKRVTDAECAWGLFADGWALAGDGEGGRVFPLWPARAYAEACATDSWAGYAPREVPLDELLEELLPRLEQDGVRPGVFFTPAGQGVTPPPERLREDLLAHRAEWYGE